MKIKSKVFIVALLSVIMSLAIAFGFGSIKQEKAGLNGIYAGEFTALAEEETQGEVGVVQGKLSTDGAYLLLATPLTIVDFSEYTAVGYEITKDGEALVADGLESNAYYTGITVNTANGTTTWTMADIFGESATGMIVAEIEYNPESDYVIRPYAIKGDTPVYGEEQTNAVPVTYNFEAESMNVKMTSGQISTVNRNAKGYVGGFDGKNASLTFYVTSNKATTATLAISLSKRPQAKSFAGNWDIKVNGESVETSASQPSASSEMWESFATVTLADVQLVKGENELSFTLAKTVPCVGGNVDKIVLTSTAKLEWAPHKCVSACLICGNCTNANCSDTVCATKCAGHAGPTSTNVIRFEAESSNPVGVGGKYTISTVGAASGGKVVGGIHGLSNANQYYYLTFEVNAEEACIAKLYFGISAETAYTAGNKWRVNANGFMYSSSTTIAKTGWDGYNEYLFTDSLKLVKGKNVIEVVMIATDIRSNFDYIGICADTTLTPAYDM